MAKKIILVMVPPESQWLFATGERCQVQLRAHRGPKVVLWAGPGGGSKKRRARNEDSEMKRGMRMRQERSLLSPFYATGT